MKHSKIKLLLNAVLTQCMISCMMSSQAIVLALIYRHFHALRKSMLYHAWFLLICLMILFHISFPCMHQKIGNSHI